MASSRVMKPVPGRYTSSAPLDSSLTISADLVYVVKLILIADMTAVSHGMSQLIRARMVTFRRVVVIKELMPHTQFKGGQVKHSATGTFSSRIGAFKHTLTSPNIVRQ